jgi:predicted nucleotidyltransferase
MRRAANPNIELIELAVARLGALADEMVFLGGCATGLLITDPLAPPIRATNDVDVISEVASLIEYQRLSKRLRAQGFSEDQSSDAPICRWQAQGVVLDVMPTSPEILGFGNPWYQPAFTVAGQMTLPSGRKIRMVSAPYFLATKLAAFEGRGQGDYVASHDLEDIVAVLDGRPEVVEEVRNCDSLLRAHLQERLTALLQEARFLEALPGHMPGDTASQARVPIIIERLKAIA